MQCPSFRHYLQSFSIIKLCSFDYSGPAIVHQISIELVSQIQHLGASLACRHANKSQNLAKPIMPLFESNDHAVQSTETSPLLGSRSSVRDVSPSGIRVKAFTADCRLQVILLCYARLMEPLAFFSIFPYVAEMVQRNGHLHHADIGLYSGLIEALFSATQAVTLFFWGTWADRFGRKPMLVISLMGMTIGTAVFSISDSIWQMMLFRSLTGLFSGSNLIIRTMVGENCAPETRATFFAWYASAANLGIFIGPIVGGALSNPAIQYPGAFGDIPFLHEHPYALSGFATAAMNATSVITSIVALKETKPRKADKRELESNEPPKTPPRLTSLREILRAPKVLAVIGVYSHVMALAIFFTAIHPVVLYTKVSFGGFGLSTAAITGFITSVGATETLWLMIAFPLLQRRMGTKGVLKACCWLWPIFFAGYVATNALLRHDHQILAKVVSVSNIIIGPGAFMSFTAVQVAINEVSPSPEALAKLNSVAEFSFSIIRSIISAVATAVFAAGARGGNGYLAWIVLLASAMALPFALCLFPDSQPVLSRTRSRDCETCSCRSDIGSTTSISSIAQL